VEIPKEYASKEDYVNNIFSTIARRYDLLNSVLSFNQDKRWRRFAVARGRISPGEKVLDVCCGTGMFALEAARAVGPNGRVVGLDLNNDMLEVARQNLQGHPEAGRIELIEGNAMDLPFADHSFDAATIGFALRNVPDITKTLQEMLRVVRPGGRVINLELAKPSALGFKQAYYLYFNHLVPILGRLGIGRSGPYSYLPASLKDFPHQREIQRLFIKIGMPQTSCDELTGGIVAVHVGVKPA